ncbi:MAG: NAD(P)-dependent dehydrogenase (short-subunit alcohol dehydrogenase family) [Candidatus Azotimanducaceae bacterium]|jgi:NAD(P)-dependent dehydrogenase (short-subunit alcohol dehydrogenase family)
MSKKMTAPVFGYRSTALDVVVDVDLSSKNAIITGGYSGIGYETVIALTTAGAQVTIAGRDIDRANKAADEINAMNLKGSVATAKLDLGSLESAAAFASAYSSSHECLDILINNAAVMACPQEQTADGFEMQFGTNHLGHYALVRLLLPKLLASAGARVVCLSSTGHMISPVVFDDINFENRAYDPWASYGQAKSANSLTAVAIQTLYADQGVEAFAVHPGGIMTSLQRHMSKADIESRGWVDTEGNVNERFKTVAEGASTSTWAATAPELKGQGGVYLEDCGFAEICESRPEFPKGVISYAVDKDQANRLWQLSEEMIETKLPGYFS